MKVTKDMTMGEMMQMDMGIAYVLMDVGMGCVACPSSIGETLEEACEVHGLNADQVLEYINDYLEDAESNDHVFGSPFGDEAAPESTDQK